MISSANPATCNSYKNGNKTEYYKKNCVTTTYYSDTSCLQQFGQAVPTPEMKLGCHSEPGFDSFVYVCGANPAPSPSPSSTSCFAGSETVELRDGSVKALQDVQVGDEVRVASISGADVALGSGTSCPRTLHLDYSPVVSIPHSVNMIKTVFKSLVMRSGRVLKLTADHLVVAGDCDRMQMRMSSSSMLKQAGSLTPGQCVLGQDGVPDTIISVSDAPGEGVYTVVPLAHDKLLVVSGIVASPFAQNHAVANAFYSVHRAVYVFAPWLLHVNMWRNALNVFGDMVVQSW